MKSKIATFLMFGGQAEEAMNLYTSIFEQSEIVSVEKYGADQGDFEGRILHATFSLKGREFMCIDSNIEHGFTFTPAISLYVNCDTKEELNLAFEALSKDGMVLMPLGSYPFSKQYAWVQDRFGVSWQLSLTE